MKEKKVSGSGWSLFKKKKKKTELMGSFGPRVAKEFADQERFLNYITFKD